MRAVERSLSLLLLRRLLCCLRRLLSATAGGFLGGAAAGGALLLGRDFFSCCHTVTSLKYRATFSKHFVRFADTVCMNRRSFLAALFGTAAAPAVPLPKVITPAPDGEGMSIRCIDTYGSASRIDVMYGFRTIKPQYCARVD